MLKLPFANDSNSLDKRFYGELLHLIGLSETKEGGKKLIERNKIGERNSGSLLENAIVQIDSLDKLSRISNPSQFGKTQEERLFNLGLELCITWINRILFLKLLEAQLKTYHKKDKSYEFLNCEKIANYDALNKLFFQVLAKEQTERSEDVKMAFAKVPYLNSSLFEPTEIEHNTLFISNLEDDKTLPIYSASVLKTENGKKKTGNLNAIEYLFQFLDAYDFSSEGSEEIQEDNKTLINASVLGLIFEKINGYKDGSFFTPGFITMYMCKESIRKAVLQKFNETKNWNCDSITSLYNKIDDVVEANKIINSLKICDPAVGSGHFLVSSLNEIIAIKNDLKILSDRNGKRLKEYQFEVVNDELIVTDENGELFEYKPTNKESQRLQETLFHEKQTIIENCLFGVDINPNSVKICRLRLWIELLKNAYYRNDTELETLPNIDINIKCGNSLISRFDLDSDLKIALKNSKWNIETYRIAVDTYRNAQNKTQKREMEQLIESIKSDFRSTISINDPKIKQLNKLKGEILTLTNMPQLFEKTKTEKATWNKKLQKLTEDSKKLETEISEIKNNKIYENAFEWRFEFPEVLDNDGNFVGFDVVIGNPPYVGITEISKQFKIYFETIYKTAKHRFDLYTIFIEKAMQIKQLNGVFTFIIPGKFLNNKQFLTARKIVCENKGVSVVKIDEKVFEDAQVDSVIIANYPENKSKYKSFNISTEKIHQLSEVNLSEIIADKEMIFRLEINPIVESLLSKIKKNSVKVIDIGEVKDGIIAGRIKDLLFINSKINDDCHKLYFGRQITRYHLSNTEVWINYKPKEMMVEELIRVGNKGPGLRMRDISIFEREKIIYRKVGKELIATLAPKDIFYEQTIHSCHIKDKTFKIKYVLALFNSNLFKFYYHNTNSQGGDIFPQMRISSVENLPIKISDFNTQTEIELLVNQILAAKSQNPTADTSILEAEIDQLVYQLYELTEEEIAIVESAV